MTESSPTPPSILPSASSPAPAPSGTSATAAVGHTIAHEHILPASLDRRSSTSSSHRATSQPPRGAAHLLDPSLGTSATSTSHTPSPPPPAQQQQPPFGRKLSAASAPGWPPNRPTANSPSPGPGIPGATNPTAAASALAAKAIARPTSSSNINTNKINTTTTTTSQLHHHHPHPAAGSRSVSFSTYSDYPLSSSSSQFNSSASQSQSQYSQQPHHNSFHYSTQPSMSALLAHLQHHVHNSSDEHGLSGRLPSAFDDEDDESASSVDLNGDREREEHEYDYATPRRQDSGGSASMMSMSASMDAADFAQQGGMRRDFGRSRPQSLGPGGGGLSDSDVGGTPFDNIGLSGGGGASGGAGGGRVRPSLQTQFGAGKLAHGASPLSASAVGGRFSYRASSIAEERDPPIVEHRDHSNMSPFRRDVSQQGQNGGASGYYQQSSSASGGGGGGGAAGGIWGAPGLHNQHSSYANNNNNDQLYDAYGGGASRNHPDAYYHPNGGASGTASRRHSVSVVQQQQHQPSSRRISIGFNPSSSSSSGDPPSPTVGSGGGFGGRGGGAMFSDDELAGSLNMLSLNSLDQDISSRPVPRVSGPSAPSSLPTYAPHSHHQQNPYGSQHQQPSPFNHMASASSSSLLRGASPSPLDALRVGSSSYSSMGGNASSPTSSLGAPGDELGMGMGRRTGGRARMSSLSGSARSSSRESSSLERSGVDDGSSSSPERAYAAPVSTSAYTYGGESLGYTAPAPGYGAAAAYGYASPGGAVAGYGFGFGMGMNARIPSPVTTTLNATGTTFRATDALKTSSSLAFVGADSREASRERYGSSASDMNGQPPSPTMQTRGRSTSIHQVQGSASSPYGLPPPQMNVYNNNYGYMNPMSAMGMMESTSNVNTPRGPISLSPQNSVHHPTNAPPPLNLPPPGSGAYAQRGPLSAGAYGYGGGMVGNGGYNNGMQGQGGGGLPGAIGPPGFGRPRGSSSAGMSPGGIMGHMRGPSASGPNNNQFPVSSSPTSATAARAPLNQSSMGLSSPASATAPNAADPDVQLGKGTPLYAVPRDAPLYIVEFKAGRNDIFYVADPEAFFGASPVMPSSSSSLDPNSTLEKETNSAAGRRGELRVGELVIVEADRGRDLGRVTHGNISTADVEAWQRSQAEAAAVAALQGHPVNGGGGGGASGGEDGAVVGGKIGIKELMPKRIYARASAEDTRLLQAKQADEMKALQLCQSKVRQKKLPMEVVDAEYQWDRRKLTFYFVADRRIDFRELVRELFRLYKTRIWMASLQGPMASE